jgi:hypothetical protein
MTKVLNTLKSVLTQLASGISNQYFYFIGLLWMIISFMYIGKTQFWTILGFAILFTGVQNLINEIKLNRN